MILPSNVPKVSICLWAIGIVISCVLPYRTRWQQPEKKESYESICVGEASLPQTRCFGHRRSSSLPVPPAVHGKQLNNGKVESEDGLNPREGNPTVDLAGLVDTFKQISESLSRPANILLEVLDQKNGNMKQKGEGFDLDVTDGLYYQGRIEIALKQMNTVQGNLKHVLPHMESILAEYKTMKEKTQSRDEMMKTLDKALRRSEGRNRALKTELQDMRDENKCLKEKAQQNESILRYLNTDNLDKGDVSKLNRRDGKRSKKLFRNQERSASTGKLDGKREVNSDVFRENESGSRDDIDAKLGHYQKLLYDYETQLQEVVSQNKQLVLQINERESEVMNLNCELLKHQETLTVYEEGFKNLSRDNNELGAGLREEKKRNSELSEKLEDTEGYISCITDKVASYEVELKYLRQELRKRAENNM